MEIDGPAAQLNRELQCSIRAALKPRRPIIHHLNDDSSWLFQIPRPENAIKRGSRVYFNIVIDPWFTGSQIDVASWFSQQYHATPSAVQSVKELEELIRRVERLAATSTIVPKRADEHVGEDDISLIDVIAISHEFTDHCHRDTLVKFHRDVAVFAFQEAATLIQSWQHFRTVIPISTPGLDECFDWRTSSIYPLPTWIGICRLKQTKDPFGTHSALLITFNNRHGKSQAKRGPKSDDRRNGFREDALKPSEDEDAAEALIYTPHGVHYADLEIIPRAVPSISTLVFLHGLHNVQVGSATGGFAMQLNLGSHNGLKAQRVLNASYWIGTHDEVKTGRGLVSWFLQRDSLTIQDALDYERRSRQNGAKADSALDEVLVSFDDTAFVTLRNGESKILL